jgi:uncharacterized membrane protein YkoI
MRAGSRGVGDKVIGVGAPAILILLGWLGFPDGAAALEVRMSPGFTPRLAATGEDFSFPIVGIGPGTWTLALVVSHTAFLLGNLQSAATHLVADQDSDATQHSEMPKGAKVTRDQAIAIALKAVPGRATSVEIEQKLGRLVYTVEVMPSGGNETDVFVDVASGEVVGTDQ